MALISVIVPVYNTEKYLPRCIDSILAQTFTDLELLLIDDGSTDSSGKICDGYAVKDRRIRVFHKENSGVSSARNMGLDNAKGEWIAFVDADDYLYNDALENLLKESQADLIVGGYLHVGISSKKNNPYSPENRMINIKNDAKFFSNMIGRYLTTPWCKLFRKDIIQDKNLRFSKDLFYGEDTDFVFRYVHLIDTIQFISKQVYCYCDAENTFGKYHLNAKHFKKLIDCTYQNFELFAKKTDLSYFEVQYIFLCDYSSLYLNRMMNIHSYVNFMKEVNEYKKEKCICFTNSFKYKTMIAMLDYCPFFAFFCIRLYKFFI